MTNVIHPRYESIAGPPLCFLSHVHVQDVEAGVLNHRAVHRLVISHSLSRGDGDQLLFSFGKELWVVVEVVIAEGAVCMGLGLATLRALPSLFSGVGGAFHALVGVLDGLRLISRTKPFYFPLVCHQSLVAQFPEQRR